MADEGADPKDGDGGGRSRRSLAERREFANVVLHWAASVNSMRALVDRYDQSVESLREAGETLDVVGRDRKVAAILKTTALFAETETLSAETRIYLDALATALMGMTMEPPT